METDSNMQTNLPKENGMKSRFLSQIIPVTGCISYEIFSSNIMIPKRFSECCGRRDLVVADALWLNAHIGIGLYIYNQRLLQRATTPWRITYTVFGTAVFNFGSVLMWGTAKSLIPRTPEGLKLLFGLGSGLALLYIGKTYFEFIDQVLPEEEDLEESDVLEESNVEATA